MLAFYVRMVERWPGAVSSLVPAGLNGGLESKCRKLGSLSVTLCSRQKEVAISYFFFCDRGAEHWIGICLWIDPPSGHSCEG